LPGARSPRPEKELDSSDQNQPRLQAHLPSPKKSASKESLILQTKTKRIQAHLPQKEFDSSNPNPF